MAWFTMPFADFHQLNLDWLISKYKKLEDDEATIQESLEGAEAAKEEAEASAAAASDNATAASAYATDAGASASDAAETAESISNSLNQIELNTTRIDNLIANAGDGTIPSELVDVRIGADAMTYTTAGNAIRSNDLYNSYESAMLQNYEEVPLSGWAPGYLDTDGTIHTQSSNKELTCDNIDFVQGQKMLFVVKIPTGSAQWAAVGYYDTTGAWVNRGSLSASTVTNNGMSIHTYELPAWAYNALTCRLSFRSYDNYTAHLYREKMPSQDWKNGPGVKAINHRGYMIDSPENTLPAFRLSKKFGFNIVETDLRLTSDGVPVLLHDATINRTARLDNGSTISGTVAM